MEPGPSGRTGATVHRRVTTGSSIDGGIATIPLRQGEESHVRGRPMDSRMIGNCVDNDAVVRYLIGCVYYIINYLTTHWVFVWFSMTNLLSMGGCCLRRQSERLGNNWHCTIWQFYYENYISICQDIFYLNKITMGPIISKIYTVYMSQRHFNFQRNFNFASERLIFRIM